MTESNDTEQTGEEEIALSFGERLLVERKRQNLTVADVAAAIHLPEKVIDAIDRSDISELPQPAFVQGYLRIYAKYLGISENAILDSYSQSVPHKQEAALQPRSMLPGEASSNSPIVKMITILLLVAIVVAVLYASLSYYKNAIEKDNEDSEVGSSLSLPVSSEIGQAEMGRSDLPESELEASAGDDQDVAEDNTVEAVIEINNADITEPPVKVAAEDVPAQVVDKAAEEQKPANQLIAKGEDSLVFLAEQVSWLEVVDANGVSLYYDLLQKDQSISLKGTAPFKVFVGNAPQVKIKMNDISVNVEKYIRSNNIAHFSISVDQQQIVFH